MARSVYLKNGRRQAELFQFIFMTMLADGGATARAKRNGGLPTHSKVDARVAMTKGEVRTLRTAVGIADLYHEQKHCLLNVKPHQEYHARMGRILDFAEATGLATRLQLRPYRAEHQALAANIPYSMGAL